MILRNHSDSDLTCWSTNMEQSTIFDRWVVTSGVWSASRTLSYCWNIHWSVSTLTGSYKSDSWSDNI